MRARHHHDESPDGEEQRNSSAPRIFFEQLAAPDRFGNTRRLNPVMMDDDHQGRASPQYLNVWQALRDGLRDEDKNRARSTRRCWDAIFLV